jgi:hypothetical protein
VRPGRSIPGACLVGTALVCELQVISAWWVIRPGQANGFVFFAVAGVVLILEVRQYLRIFVMTPVILFPVNSRNWIDRRFTASKLRAPVIQRLSRDHERHVTVDAWLVLLEHTDGGIRLLKQRRYGGVVGT